MTNQKWHLFLAIIIPLVIGACSLSGITSPTATPDAQATIDAAIAATSTAQAEMQAEIDQAVEATVTAMPDESEPQSDLDTEAYLQMTEEELNEEIDKAVDEAMAATEQSTEYAEDAASDDTLTEEELALLLEYAAYAEEMLYLAEELIGIYYDLYADLVYETIYLLEAVEEDLDTMAAAITEITEVAVAAAETLEAGQEVRQETIEQILASAESTQDALQTISPDWQAWSDSLQSERQERLEQVQEIAPNYVPADRQEALAETLGFVEAVRVSLEDRSLSEQELFDIAQLSANAVAGLEAHGGPQLQNLAGNISSITDQLALGQTPQALDSLGALEGSLGQLPDLPEIPSRGGRKP